MPPPPLPHRLTASRAVLLAALVAGVAAPACRRDRARVERGDVVTARLTFDAGDGPRTAEGARLVGEATARLTATGEAARTSEAVGDEVRRALVATLETLLASQPPEAATAAAPEALRAALAASGLDLVSLDASGLRIPGDERRALLAPTTDLEILLVGLDGYDWDVAEPLMARGRLPALSALVERGTRARLATIQPMLSPVIWTSMATGREPSDHGILDFLGTDARGRPVPVTSNLRTKKAFWNVLSEAGQSVGVTAWWATWPAEPVNGFLVSDRVAYQLFQVDDSKLPPTGKVYPAALWPDVEPAIVRPSEVRAEEVRSFLDTSVAAPAEPQDVRLVEQFAAVLASAKSYAAIGLKLHDRIKPRVGAYYFESPDTASHLFMKFAPPRLPEVDAARHARFAHVVDRTYELHDRILAQFVERAGEKTVVIVVSDHGFRSGAARPASDSRVEAATAAEWHERFGVLVVAGPGIRRGHEIAEASILDVFPTMLALLGMPVATDLDGRVLEEALEPDFLRAHPVRQVPSFEDAGAPPGARRVAAASPEDRAILESLIAIGYVSPLAREAADGGGGAATAGGANAHNNMGLIHMNQGDDEAALAEFRLAVQGMPDFPQARVNLAHALLRLGRTDDARRELEAVLAKDPANDRALSLLADLHLEAGRTEDAVAAARRAVEQDPRSAPGWMTLGNAHEAARRFTDAEAAFRRAAEVDPDNPEPLNAMGGIHERAGRYAEAATWYEKSLETDPTFAAGYNNLALQYQRLGRWQDALRVYEEGRRRLPSSSILLNNLATWHHHVSRQAFQEARTLLGRGATEPARAARARAEAAAAEAERLYEQAMSADPLDPSPVNNLGALRGSMGDEAGELALYRRAVEMNPRYVDALHNVADWHSRRSDWAPAHETLQRALGVDPDHPDVLRLDAQALVGLGRHSEAVVLLESALERRPAQPNLLTSLGAVHDQAGETDRACRRYRESLRWLAQDDVAARVAQLCK